MKIAIFPGRFQPPHVGHILTLMRMYPLYDKILIAISTYTYGGKKKKVMSIGEVQRILEDIFKHLPKYEVIVIGKGWIERDRYDNLPHFDVVVSGNLEVIRKSEKLGIKARHQTRSTVGNLNLSGAMLRKLFKWEL